jgi:putative transposase
MKILKGFRYRLYPTEEQGQMLLQHGGNARFLWNYLLEDNIEHYKRTGKFKFAREMILSIPKMKEEYGFLTLSFSQSLQQVALHLDKALRDCFENDRGFPKFKAKSKMRDSFTIPQRWKLRRGAVYIPKVGWVRWRKYRALQGKPKHITITQDGDQWYCSVTCEVEIPDKEKEVNNLVGIDVGLKEFAVLSGGTVIKNPKYLRRYEKKLAREQRRLSRKEVRIGIDRGGKFKRFIER